MLQLSNVSKGYAGRTLFEDASFQIIRGDRAGLVGPNGAGKSTLFSILLNEETPDEGKVLRERGISVGFLAQETAPAGDETVLELATSHMSESLGWEAEPKAKRILRGLAFRDSDFDRPARTLSGGWVMRAHLARLLVQEPDLLLLDEPTNHLDLESLGWFQEYLRGYPGAILMISHDREFLNQLIRRVIEIAHGKLHFYTGNYDAYRRDKVAREEQHLAAYENQQKEIGRLQDFADRFRAKATKAAQAQSKLKQIDRMEKIAAPVQAMKTVGFKFPQPARSGLRVVTLKNIEFGYTPAQRIYEGLNFEAERGQRTVLVGPNGAGKSTLLKILAGVLTHQGGERVLGHNVKAGYFAQNRSETLNPNRTVLAEAMDLENRPPEQLTRTLLGSFLFSGDDVFKPVGVLSGGEKSRLALCKLLLDPPNLLLMDEPTTHLDIPSIDALVGALKAFEGTLLFISHDVYFIRTLATTVLHISAGKLTPYAGDYQYYLDKSNAVSERGALVAGEKLSDSRPEDRPAAAGPGQRIFKTREEKRALAKEREAAQAAVREQRQLVAKLEGDAGKLEKQQQALTTELEAPATYDNPARAMQINRELLGVGASLERVTAQWEKETEKLAEMEKA